MGLTKRRDSYYVEFRVQTEVPILFGIEKGDRGQQEAAAPKASVGEFFERRLSASDRRLAEL